MLRRLFAALDVVFTQYVCDGTHGFFPAGGVTEHVRGLAPTMQVVVVVSDNRVPLLKSREMNNTVPLLHL